MAVLLECSIFHDWRQLVVIANEHNALQPADTSL
jgi:hypothetical protein